MKAGTGLDTLMQAVQASRIARKRLLDSQTVNVNIKRKGDKLEWQLSDKMNVEASGKKSYEGGSLDDLRSRIEYLFREKTWGATPQVLCLVEEKMTVVKYLVCDIDDYQKFIKTGTLKFPEITVLVSDYEKIRCLETRLALYDGESIYPITKSASTTFGQFLDAWASFKNISELPLGEALLLNEKLYSVKQLDGIYENSSSKIKPLISICTTRYERISQPEYIETMLRLIGNTKLYYDSADVSWKIEDNITVIDIPLSGISLFNLDYQPIIRLVTSDIPGQAYKVMLLGKVSVGTVLIKENRAIAGSSIAPLMDGIEEAVSEFNGKSGVSVTVTEGLIKKLAVIVGKKRISTKVDGEYVTNLKTCGKTVALYEFIEDTYRDLPSAKQERDLMKLYGEAAGM